MFLPHPRVKVSIVGSLRDREVACSASDRQGSNFESCVWRTVSSQSSHHPQEVLLAQFSLYVHKGGLKPDSFHFTWSHFCEFKCDFGTLHEVYRIRELWISMIGSAVMITISRDSWIREFVPLAKVAKIKNSRILPDVKYCYAKVRAVTTFSALHDSSLVGIHSQ